MSKPTKTKRKPKRAKPPEELDARLRQLAQDYFAAFFRDPTEEKLQKAQLLSAIGYSPETMRKLAGAERQLANREAGTHKTFWREVWVRLVPTLVEHWKGDPVAVARDLVTHVPAPYRAKCPNYPTNSGELEDAVTAVAGEGEFQDQLELWKGRGPWDPVEVARAVMRGLGMPAREARSLFRKEKSSEQETSTQT